VGRGIAPSARGHNVVPDA